MLVIRVWVEPGTGDGFRARITRTLDLESREETVTAAASPAEVTAVLVDWLDAFVAASTEVTER